MKIVYTLGGNNPYNNKASALIEVKQEETKRALFTVSYGQQVESGLTYSEACKSLGSVILHHLGCEGVVNTEGN